jgi:WD40 repeat protein
MIDRAACPDEVEWQRWLLGQLSGEEADRLEEHLEACQRCVQSLATVHAEDTLVEAMQAQAGLARPREDDGIEDLVQELCRLSSARPTLDFGQGDTPADFELRGVLAPQQTPEELGAIGPYRIKRILGRGGMGVVFEAEDPQLQRPVALKLMKPSLAASETARRRFLREARAAASIHHDHVVTIYQVGEHRGIPYLAMPLLGGETLTARLARDGKLPLDAVLQIAGEIAAGLAAAHEQGVVHRDVKPDNVWLEETPSGPRVKILDFGLAQVADPETRLTRLGTLGGTPAYMAPEQARGEPVDHRADLFSLGCTIYEMCTGRAPFSGPDPVSTLMSVAESQPPPPHELAPEVPRWLSDLTMHLLEKDRSRRICSAREVLETLQRQAHSYRSAAGRPPRRFRPRWLLAAAGAAAILLGVVVYVATSGGTLIIDVKQPGATVKIDAKEIEIQSSQGPIRIRLPAGKHEVHVSREGFAPHQQEVSIHWRDRVEVSVDLKPQEPIVELRRFEGHTDTVTCVAFSRDGRRVLSGSRDGTLRFWDAQTGAEIRRFGEGTDPVACAAFSPDEKWILSGSDREGILRLWDTETGREIRRFEGHTDRVKSAAFSPDGKWVLSGSFDTTVRLWETATGRPLKTLTGHTTWVRSVGFSPDGRWAISAGNDAVVLVWDLQREQPARALQGHLGPIASAVFSPDGSQALSTSWDWTIILWSVAGESKVRAFEGHTNTIFRAVFLSQGDYVLSSSADKTLRLWDARRGTSLARVLGHSASVPALAVSRDGQYAVSGSDDRTVRLWSLPSAESLAQLAASAAEPRP